MGCGQATTTDHRKGSSRCMRGACVQDVASYVHGATSANRDECQGRVFFQADEGIMGWAFSWPHVSSRESRATAEIRIIVLVFVVGRIPFNSVELNWELSAITVGCLCG